MFIRLFIKTIDNDKVEMAIKYLMSYINKDNIKYKDIKTELYWKFDNTTVAEVQLELHKPLKARQRIIFLIAYQIDGFILERKKCCHVLLWKVVN